MTPRPQCASRASLPPSLHRTYKGSFIRGEFAMLTRTAIVAARTIRTNPEEAITPKVTIIAARLSG